MRERGQRMDNLVIEFDRECYDCGGTGLYVGLAERDGAAVVCWKCKGTGCCREKIEYQPFRKRKQREGIEWVYQVGAGLVVGKPYTKWGGMSVANWEAGCSFGTGRENRGATCPRWWFQCVNAKRLPEWDECNHWTTFPKCRLFPDKHNCWERWDKEVQGCD